MSPSNLLSTFMLALCVWREARGESKKGKELVAQTILNRTKDKRWPSTIVGVVTQRKQFSSFNAGDPNALLFPTENDKAWKESVEAAEEILGYDTPITLANHYHTTGVAPKWADSTRIVDREGHHIFYRL